MTKITLAFDKRVPSYSGAAPTPWLCFCAKWTSGGYRRGACWPRHWSSSGIWTKWRQARGAQTGRHTRRSGPVGRIARLVWDCCSACTRGQCTKMVGSSCQKWIGVFLEKMAENTRGAWKENLEHRLVSEKICGKRYNHLKKPQIKFFSRKCTPHPCQKMY